MAGYLANFLAKIGLDTTDFNAGMDKATRTVKKFGSDLEAAGKSMALGITVPLAGLAVGALKASADLESLKMGLTAITGNAGATEQQLTRLKKVAELPGLSFKEAVQGSINLQAAGFSATLAERSLKAFGNALATVGKGKSELEAVNVQLTQMAIKPKVLSDDLKPLMNHLPQISKAMQDAFGTKNIEDIQKLGVSGQEFIEKIVKEFEKLPPVTGGLKNSFENLTDSLFLAAAAAGDALKPIATRLINDFAQPAIAKIKELAEAFSALPVPLQNVTLGVTAAAAAFPLLTIAIGSTITNAIAITNALGGLANILSKAGVAAQLFGKAFLPVAVGMAIYWGGNKLLEYGSDLDKTATAMDKLNQKFKVFAANRGLTVGDRAGSGKIDAVIDFLSSKLPAAAEKAAVDVSAALKGLGLKSTVELQKELDTARKHFEALKKAGTEAPGVMADAAKKVKDAYEALYPSMEKVERTARRIAEMPRGDLANIIPEAPSLEDLKNLPQGIDADGALRADWRFSLLRARPEIEALANTLSQELARSLNEADLSGRNLKITTEAFSRAGLKTAEELSAFAKSAEEDYDVIRNSGTVSADAVTTAWVRWKRAINEAQAATGEITNAAHDATETALKDIERRTKAEERATKVIRNSRYELSRELEQQARQTFNSLERDIARNIVSWKGWVDTIKNVGKGFAEDFLSIMMKGLFKPLEDQFAKLAVSIGNQLDDALAGFWKALGVGGGKVGGLTDDMIDFGSKTQSAAVDAATGGLGAAKAGSGVAGAASSAAGAASGLVGIIGAVGSIGTMVSSIVGNFQFAGMNKSLDLIVTHTLRLYNETEMRRKDAWEQYNQMYFRIGEQLNVMQGIRDAVRGTGGVVSNGKLTIENKIYLDGKQIATALYQTAQLAGT